jgi:RNA polymerase sigma-70 factor, ECF subfamily
VEGVQPGSLPHGATLDDLGGLYERYYHRYLRVAEAIVGEVELAHDVVQDAFARAIRGRAGYRASGSVEGWLWRTLVNTARTARRDRPPASLPLSELEDAPPSPGSGVSRADLPGAIAALPERQRLVLFLRYYADLDYRQIADALEIRQGTVGATLNQAHASLRGALEEVAT